MAQKRQRKPLWIPTRFRERWATVSATAGQLAMGSVNRRSLQVKKPVLLLQLTGQVPEIFFESSRKVLRIFVAYQERHVGNTMFAFQ